MSCKSTVKGKGRWSMVRSIVLAGYCMCHKGKRRSSIEFRSTTVISPDFEIDSVD
jgi:hypothetical protein